MWILMYLWNFLIHASRHIWYCFEEFTWLEFYLLKTSPVQLSFLNCLPLRRKWFHLLQIIIELNFGGQQFDTIASAWNMAAAKSGKVESRQPNGAPGGSKNQVFFTIATLWTPHSDPHAYIPTRNRAMKLKNWGPKIILGPWRLL